MKKAFTLIELLIVIIIMGVVYTLAINNFTKLSDENSSVGLLNIKEYLSAIPHAKSVKLVCLDDCAECSVYVDGVKNRDIDGFLDESVTSYRYDFSYGFLEVEKEIVFDSNDVEKDVCFSFDIDKKGVPSQVLVEFKEKFYDLSSYLNKTMVYNSMQEALEMRENLSKEVMR